MKKRKYYVMFGFEEANPNHTVYLAINDTPNGKLGYYEIVENVDKAKRFPARNYDKLKGFATPEKWAKFFAEEDELQEWNFHPVAIKK